MIQPIKKLDKKVEDKSKDCRIIFSILTGRNSHILTIVIVGHLLIEYLLDKIITTKFKNVKKVVGKSFAETNFFIRFGCHYFYLKTLNF